MCTVSWTRERGQASVEYIGLIALVGLLFAGGLALAATPKRPAEETVDRYMAASLDEFLAYRASPRRDPRLDWSTDLCSAPIVGSRGESFDFTQACLRHDFGYRNYGRLGLFDNRRKAVDERFLADMRDHCATRLAWELVRCMAWARRFYLGVRAFGWAAGPDR
jgi:Prokaryotic phospholipase A2